MRKPDTLSIAPIATAAGVGAPARWKKRTLSGDPRGR